MHAVCPSQLARILSLLSIYGRSTAFLNRFSSLFEGLFHGSFLSAGNHLASCRFDEKCAAKVGLIFGRPMMMRDNAPTHTGQITRRANLMGRYHLFEKTFLPKPTWCQYCKGFNQFISQSSFGV
jgi:hypothetical protein